jgi:hypothetical protein
MRMDQDYGDVLDSAIGVGGRAAKRQGVLARYLCIFPDLPIVVGKDRFTRIMIQLPVVMVGIGWRWQVDRADRLAGLHPGPVAVNRVADGEKAKCL